MPAKKKQTNKNKKKTNKQTNKKQTNKKKKKHTQHAPSTKTECDYLNGWIKKRSHTQKSHPKVVNPRDIAGERKKKNNKKKTQNKTKQTKKKNKKKKKKKKKKGSASINRSLVCLSIAGTQMILTFMPQTGEHRQQTHTQHAPSTKTELDYPNGWIKNAHCNEWHSFHARVGRFSPFLYLRSVAIAVILFWLQLVVLVSPCFLGSRIPRDYRFPRAPLFLCSERKSS